MRLLHFTHLYPSGVQPEMGPFVHDRVHELARRGHQITMVNPLWIGGKVKRSRAATVPVEASEDGVRVIRSPRFGHLPVGGRLVAPWLWTTRARPVLERENARLGGADIIHAHSAIYDGFAASRFAKHASVPLVISLWGSDILEYGRQPVTRSFVASAVRRADALIAVSDELADRACELGADRSRMHVLVGGVAYRDRQDGNELRRVLGIPDDEKVLLWVGGLVPVKQPLHAVEAFARLHAAGTHLVMVGAGPLEQKIAQAVTRLGLGDRVHLLGHLDRSDVWRWQCSAKLVLNCSHSEGTPFALLEAMGAGTPVACYPLPGVRAAVEAVGGGEIAEASTPEALAAAVERLLAAPPDQAQLASAARGRYGLARVVDGIEAVYARVNSERARAQ